MSVDINIKKSFEDFELNFKLNTDAKIIGILGPSGCGKSLLLKSIAGIVRPDFATIEIDEKRLEAVKTKDRKVGYLFQNYALFPTMTVADNITVGIKDRRGKRELLESSLDKYKLKGLEKHFPGQLSGGQQQRVALARMMAHAPKVLLFDEPFSAMDSYLRESLRVELKRMLDSFEGTSIIVTHDRDEAYQLCEELVLMDCGRVIQHGRTKDIFMHPNTVSAARLTGVKNISAIKKVDAYHAQALDWNNEIIETANEITEDVKYIGIRAHDLVAATESTGNSFSLEGAKLTEMPFEDFVFLTNGLWWKKNKGSIPQYLYAPPKAILLLKEV